MKLSVLVEIESHFSSASHGAATCSSRSARGSVVCGSINKQKKKKKVEYPPGFFCFVFFFCSVPLMKQTLPSSLPLYIWSTSATCNSLLCLLPPALQDSRFRRLSITLYTDQSDFMESSPLFRFCNRFSAGFAVSLCLGRVMWSSSCGCKIRAALLLKRRTFVPVSSLLQFFFRHCLAYFCSIRVSRAGFYKDVGPWAAESLGPLSSRGKCFH